MPNVKEVPSLIDYEMFGPALPTEHPFVNISIHRYWTSTTDNENEVYAFAVYIRYGNVWQNLKSDLALLVLPVRGGNQQCKSVKTKGRVIRLCLFYCHFSVRLAT